MVPGRCNTRVSLCSSELTQSSATVPDGGSLAIASTGRSGEPGDMDSGADMPVEGADNNSLPACIVDEFDVGMGEEGVYALAMRSRTCAG